MIDALTAVAIESPAVRPRGPGYARVVAGTSGEAAAPLLSDDEREWIQALRGVSGHREEALSRLHALLLRATSFELRRRRGQLVHLTAGDVEDLATQAADDALMAILAKLDSFRGASRFTTWAYKFALLEAGVKARRRAWQGREISIDEQMWPTIADPSRSAQDQLEATDLLDAVADAVRSSLTPHQRTVFTALALNGVPIDVLAERLHSTRGALYKTLHDARRKLRAALAVAGYQLNAEPVAGGEHER
jgi:RNA polymerase sigma-70 factor (ECF subfamily)